MTQEWPPVPAPDPAAAAACAERRALLPAGALGAFGPIADRLAAARGGRHFPLATVRPVLVVFAADHGVAAAHEISAAPVGETRSRIADLAAGAGPIACLAREAGAVVRTVDVAVAGDLSGTAVDLSHRVRFGSEPIDTHDALTEQELDACLQAGREMADAEVDGGADLLIGAVCGVGVSTPAAVLVAAVTGMEPVDATTRGSGIDDDAWIRKCAAVRDALHRCSPAARDAATLLRVAGGADLAALTGFIAQAAVRRTPVLIDDVPTAVCAVLANRLAPGVAGYLIAAGMGPDRTHARLLGVLGLEALTDFKTTLGSGAGALLMVPLIRAVTRLLDETSEAAAPRTTSAIDSWDADLL